jgi:hypothetical protein
MSLGINEHKGNITPSSGTALIPLGYDGAEIRQIIITPATSSTTFDVNIVNNYGSEVYEVTDNTGLLKENDANILMRHNGTLTIENASVDEVFTYYVSAIERYA